MKKDSKNNHTSGYKAPAVHKAFQLLRVVAQSQQGLGIVELAKMLGYSKSTTHGLVHALLREGALTQGQNARKLYLGPAMAELVFSNWKQDKVNKAAQPFLDQIRDNVRATVFLGVRIRNRVLITAAAEPEEALKLSASVGATIPLMAGAVGKVFLASEKPEQAEQIIRDRGLPRYTQRSKTDIGDYLAELDMVRDQGYALDIEEYIPGIHAVAAALHNKRGLPMAVWVVGIYSQMDEERIGRVADAVVAAVEKLRHVLDENEL